MKKKVLLVIGIVAGVALLGGVVAFAATRGLPNAAAAFLTLIEQGRFDEAYHSTAAAFRHETDEDLFVAFISRTLLPEYAGASWSSRVIENGIGRLDGTVKTKDGARIPVTLEFVKEEGDWKVLSMQMADAGFVRTDGAVPIPPGEVLIRLTNDAVEELAHAINGRDFNAFYGSISRLWQRQTTPEELHRAFTLFTAQNINLLPALETPPLFDAPPSVDASGVLALEGHYPVEQKPVGFTLKFIHEEDDWKLLAINVRM